MFSAGPANVFGKIWKAQKQGLCTDISPGVGKKGREIKAALTMPSRLQLSTLDRMALNLF
jgi:hypothetical protein